MDLGFLGLPFLNVVERVVYINLNEARIRIEMLGDFAIISGGRRIAEQVKKPSKVWKLLQYLIVHRHKAVPHDELIEVFCSGEHISDPGSSLRMLVSRARTALMKAGFPYSAEMIVSKSGGYAWNNEVHCDIDAEEFENLCKKASACTGENDRLDILLQAAELYRGDFLPNSGGELWVMPVARWYHTLYVNCMREALRILDKAERSAEVEDLCLKALRIDPFNEKFIGFHLKSLVAQGKRKDALAVYKRMEEMFYDVLGIEFSEELKEMLQVIQSPEIRHGIPLNSVLDQWLEGADTPGAFYCNISVFRTLYQIESRMALRSGRTVFIVRLETKRNPGETDGGVMKQLGLLIPGSLRMGDLYSRAGPDQYLIMLYNLTYEDCKVLVDRIIRKLDAKFLSRIVRSSIIPVTPIT